MLVSIFLAREAGARTLSISEYSPLREPKLEVQIPSASPRGFCRTTAEMSELQERFQRWADELVDLTARNELINFKVTKT